MPVYTYVCKKCDEAKDLVCSLSQKRPKRRRCHCGGTSTRVYKLPQISTFKTYVTAHITGNKVEIRSARQEDELCAQHDVARLLDSQVLKDRPAEKAKRKKRALATLEPFQETYRQVENELKYNKIPKPERTAV